MKCENGKCEMKSEVYTSGIFDKVREKCENVKCEVYKIEMFDKVIDCDKGRVIVLDANLLREEF